MCTKGCPWWVCMNQKVTVSSILEVFSFLDRVLTTKSGVRLHSEKWKQRKSNERVSYSSNNSESFIRFIEEHSRWVAFFLLSNISNFISLIPLKCSVLIQNIRKLIAYHAIQTSSAKVLKPTREFKTFRPVSGSLLKQDSLVFIHVLFVRSNLEMWSVTSV